MSTIRANYPDRSQVVIESRELLRIARMLVGSTPNMDKFRNFLDKIPGVSQAVVNDYMRASEGAYEVDFRVESSIGGRLSRTLRSRVNKFIKENDFIQTGYSHGDWFSYEDNEYVIEVIIYED